MYSPFLVLVLSSMFFSLSKQKSNRSDIGNCLCAFKKVIYILPCNDLKIRNSFNALLGLLLRVLHVHLCRSSKSVLNAVDSL